MKNKNIVPKERQPMQEPKKMLKIKKTSPVTQHAVALMQHRTTHHLANTHCTVAQSQLYHSRRRAKISTFIELFSYDCKVNM